MNNRRILIFILLPILTWVQLQPLQAQLFKRGKSREVRLSLSGDLEVLKLSDAAWMHISYKSVPEYGRVAANGLIYIRDGEAMLFDSPWTNEQTEDLLGWMEDSMQLEVKAFVPNHWHEDCMGGLEAIHMHGITSYANWMTVEMARELKLPLPRQAFRDSLELMLTGDPVYCYYPGAAHSEDNIVVWIPSEKILFPACIVKSLESSNLGNTSDGDLKAYPATLEFLLDHFPEAEIIIPGHGLPGGPELIYHTLSLCTPL